MARNSLFAILLRSSWWISVALAAFVGGVAAAVVPDAYRVVAAFSGFPFVVIAVMAAWRGRNQPSVAQVERAAQALGQTSWSAFATLLEAAFRRDGFSVERSQRPGVDFEIEKAGRRMMVAARRWKSAHVGLEPLRALQAAREAAEAPDALYIGLGALSDQARKLAAAERVAVWQAPELAQKLKGLLPPTSGG
ncbi:MAG: restriction endonuclease [Aquabacterium sp.]